MPQGSNLESLFLSHCATQLLSRKMVKKEKRMDQPSPFLLVLALSLTVLWSPLPLYGVELKGGTANKIEVFVSILPQAYFVERVGGSYVNVSVMVGPGHSPATYEPMPDQMAQLGEARLYFAIGVPFENVWIDRIDKAYPDLQTIATQRGIERLPMSGHDHPWKRGRVGREEATPHRDRGHGLKDPHIWLSPRLVKIQVKNICSALIAEDGTHRTYYEENLEAFHKDLDALDEKIAAMLKHLQNREFLILHPSLGYFAHDYGLKQIPIEIEGKSPSARSLAGLVRKAKRSGLQVIFVQEQFSTKSAQSVADAIGGEIVTFDPLAKKYLENMRKIAQLFSKMLQ
jgi:zinc transport system substrate-binding protein